MSTRKTFGPIRWKYAGKGIWVEEVTGKARMGEELVQYMAFCCAVKTNIKTTVAGELEAVNFYHEQWVGLSLPISHVRVKAVRRGIKRAHVESGSQQRVRRPLTWGKLPEIKGGSYGRIRSESESDADETGANIPAAEGVRLVRGVEWSVSRRILPTEEGCGIIPAGAAVEKRARKRGG